MSDPRAAALLQELRTRDAELQQAREELREAKAKMGGLENELQRAQLEIEDLKQRLDEMARRYFGKSSEQLDPNQLQLLLQELSAPGPAVGKESGPEAVEAPAPRPPQKASASSSSRAPRVPEHLPVVEERIVPLEVQLAPEQFRPIGEEVSERLDYTPGKFIRRRLIRVKYVRRAELDAVPVIAPLPPCLLERSILTAGLLAQIVVSKYCDHLPLYRQEYIYETRYGVSLSRQVMAQWVGVGADWLQLIYENIRAEVMAAGYLQIDETPIRYLEPGHGKTRLGYLWTCHQPGGESVYSWHLSRAASCLETIVPVDFTGKIQCDGYTGYDAFARGRPEIELVGCWAHLRRKFFAAYEAQKSKAAALILHLIQQLYKTEAELREARAGPTVRQRTRALASRRIVQQLHRILLQWQRRRAHLPQSLLGRALHYALEQWDSLLAFLDDGRVEIDNNLVENAIRPTALGKKNWLFFGLAHAGHRGAIIYTVIESCRRHEIDPYEYLRHVFERLPSATNHQVKDLTPAAWAARHHRADAERAA